MNGARHFLAQHRRLLFFIAALIIVFLLLYALRSALIPFVIGLLLAYLLLPPIRWLEQKLPRTGRLMQTKRVFLIILIYILFAALAASFSYFVVVDVIKALGILVNYAPEYITNSVYAIQRWLEGIRTLFPAEIRVEVDKALLEAGQTLGSLIRGTFTRGISSLPGTINLVFGFAALPLFLFYLLKDWEKFGMSLKASTPSWFFRHAHGILSIIEKVFGRYVRAQIMLGLVVGYLCFIGLLVLRIPFAPALAALAFVTELIPIVGPWIAGAAAVIVTLTLAPDKTIWVIVLYFIVQLMENNLLVPRVQGAYLRIHPAIIIVLIVVAIEIAGFWGTLVVVPLAATIIEIYKYARRNIMSVQSRPEAEKKELTTV